MFDGGYDPFLLEGMKESVKRIQRALYNGEEIVVFGDSDADGIAATSIVYNFLAELGGMVDYYILSRNTEHYGLLDSSVDNLLEMNPDLVITVDCGINNVMSVEKLKRRGIDTIITDHHECGGELPDAVGVIDPKISDNYPFRELAGVGVALKLIIALCNAKGLDQETYLRYMDLVALGTIADKVSITDENKEILEYGIARMIWNPSLGVKRLLKSSSLRDKSSDGCIDLKAVKDIISFELVPLLNAKGKLDQDAGICVELFATNDERRALKIVAELIKANKERRKIEREMIEDVGGKISTQVLKKDNIILASGKEWKEGILGSVASRIVEKYKDFCKAAIILAVKDGLVKGSCRSTDGVDVFRVLGSCKKNKLLQSYGGHKKACGFVCNEENMVKLKEHISNVIKISEESAKKMEKFIAKERITEIELINERAWMLRLLKTPEIFFCSGLKVLEKPRVLKCGKHLWLRLQMKDGSLIEAMAFDMEDKIDSIHEGSYIDAKFKISQYKYGDLLKINEMELSKEIPDIQYEIPKFNTIEVYASSINLDNARRIKNLGTIFFNGTKQLFLCRNMRVLYCSKDSTGKHLNLLLEGDGLHVNGIAFDMGHMIDNIERDDLIDVEFELGEFRNKVQMKIKNIKAVKELIGEEPESGKVRIVTTDKLHLDSAISAKGLRESAGIRMSFMCCKMRIMEDPQISKTGKNLMLILAGDDNRKMDAIWFNRADLLSKFKKGNLVDVRFELSEFMGKVQLIIQNLVLLKKGIEEFDVIELNKDTIFEINRLKEMGACGVFSSKGLKVLAQPQRTKTGEHLKLVLSAGGMKPMNAIAFGKWDMASKIKKDDRVDIEFIITEFAEKVSLGILKLKVIERKLEAIEVDARGITLEVAEILQNERLLKNADPVFWCRDMKVVNYPQKIKNGNHLKLELSNNDDQNLEAIAFGLGDMAGYIKHNDRVDVAFEMDEYNDEVQMKIKAIRIREWLCKNSKQVQIENKILRKDMLSRKRTYVGQEPPANKRINIEKTNLFGCN